MPCYSWAFARAFLTTYNTSHLSLPDKIQHSYLAHPSSNAASSARHILALPGNSFSNSLLCVKNSIQTPIVELYTLVLYSAFWTVSPTRVGDVGQR